MASIRQLRSLLKSCRNDCDQDSGNENLRPESEPEIPVRSSTNCRAARPADDTNQDGDETPDGLHARNENSSDESNNNSNKEAADQSGNFHVATQPLERPVEQVRRAGKVLGNTFCGNRL